MKGTATVPNSKLIKFNMRHKMRSGEKLNSVYANWIVQSAIKTRDLYTVIKGAGIAQWLEHRTRD